tara:strand:- start:265 stop:744 length:480 start_codon:yes stop_codon:yes gene_type:complete
MDGLEIIGLSENLKKIKHLNNTQLKEIFERLKKDLLFPIALTKAQKLTQAIKSPSQQINSSELDKKRYRFFIITNSLDQTKYDLYKKSPSKPSTTPPTPPTPFILKFKEQEPFPVATLIKMLEKLSLEDDNFERDSELMRRCIHPGESDIDGRLTPNLD